MNRFFPALSMLAVWVVLAGCMPAAPATPPGTRPAQPQPLSLAGTRWRLESIQLDGPAMKPAGAISLQFGQDGRAGGSAGCNSYGGSFTTSGARLSFGEMVSTLMACADETVMRQESAYLAALSRVTGAKMEDQRLVLIGDGVALTFVVAQAEPTPAALTGSALTGTRWQLESMIQGAVADAVMHEAQITLAFNADGKASGSGGCNRYSSAFTLKDGALSLGPVASTRMACQKGMEQEQQFFKLLESTAQAEMQGSSLVLTSADGQSRLVFRPVDAP